MPKPPITLFWFRRDLRLTDNTALHQAQQSGLPVLPLFIFDKNILDPLPDRRDGRVDFIRRTLAALQRSLQKYGGGLLVRIGDPMQVWKSLIREYRIHSVYVNRDYEPYAVKRDEQVAALLQASGIAWHSYKDQVIFEKGEVCKENGEPYTVFTPYMKKWRSLLRPESLKSWPLKNRAAWYRIEPNLPELKQLGFQPSNLPFPTADLPEEIVLHYDKTRNFPALAGTTRLGLHLRFGTVSIRELVRRGMLLNETWVNELIWREFFMQILHHFPHVVDGPFKPAYAGIRWQNNEALFAKWCEGRTGYPLVDAGMRELNATGFQHNRVRMLCASFLAKHLLINWQWGEKYFADKLLDFELSSNNGNWQWAAGCGCDAAPYFRIFSPELQQKRFDPKRAYITRWVAEVDTPEYPEPIVEHKQARLRALLAYQKSLQ